MNDIIEKFFGTYFLQMLEHVITKQDIKSRFSFDDIMNCIINTQKKVAIIYNKKYNVDTSTLFCQILNIISYSNKENIDDIIEKLIIKSFVTEPTEHMIENWKKYFNKNFLNMLEIVNSRSDEYYISDTDTISEESNSWSNGHYWSDADTISEESNSWSNEYSRSETNYLFDYNYKAGNIFSHNRISMKNSVRNEETNIFLSYSWVDDMKADEIDKFFKELGINIKRDKKCIENWGSIKSFMNSIKDSDYAILILSDAYLKSINCMYEVTELMRDKNYRDRIFPVVLDNSIYQLEKRIYYIIYWEEKYDILKQEIAKIKNIENIETLSSKLRQIREISYTISEFLDIINDMNNPAADGISQAIYERLCNKNLLKRKDL